MNKLNIGEFTYGKPIIIGDGDVNIGKFCSIAQNVRFITWGHHIDWFTTYPFSCTKETVGWNYPNGHPVRKNGIQVGNDIWIGDSAIILYGVKIGDGAIISAGSLVTKNVKPYSVVGGNPAERLFYRFDKNIIKILLELKWWEFPVDDIKKLAPFLCSNDKDEIIKIYNEKIKKENNV